MKKETRSGGGPVPVATGDHQHFSIGVERILRVNRDALVNLEVAVRTADWAEDLAGDPVSKGNIIVVRIHHAPRYPVGVRTPDENHIRAELGALHAVGICDPILYGENPI